VSRKAGDWVAYLKERGGLVGGGTWKDRAEHTEDVRVKIKWDAFFPPLKHIMFLQVMYFTCYVLYLAIQADK